MRTSTPTQPILVHGLAVGALLVETDGCGAETRWRVQRISPHPLHLDRVVICGDGGELRNLRRCDWIHRALEGRSQ